MGPPPNFFWEKKLLKAGFKIVAGLDEVGRGSFAGPIVAGAVAFARDQKLKVRIDDSKKLTAKQREEAGHWIKRNALAWGVGEVGVSKINRFGIKKAGETAFRIAISKVKPDFILIDAFYIPYVRGLRRRRQKAIINGDEKSISIAAASIIAKVYRDKLMLKLGKEPKYRKYGWASNKGYGTREHQTAIKKYGLTRQHRKAFVETWLKSSSSLKAQ